MSLNSADKTKEKKQNPTFGAENKSDILFAQHNNMNRGCSLADSRKDDFTKHLAIYSFQNQKYKMLRRHGQNRVLCSTETVI